MRSADIIMLLPHTETPNPHKPSRCSETEAQTVKQNNLFPLSLQPVWHGPNSANNSSAIWVCAIQSLCQHKALSYRQPCNSHCNNCSLHWHGFWTLLVCVSVCVCAYRLALVPEGRAVALDLISSLCSAVRKRLKYQSFAQSTAPGRAFGSTGEYRGRQKRQTEESKDKGKENRKRRATTS